jgi:hypothetical protein
MFEKTNGSRAEVWHGTAKKTVGGLTKSSLMKNKHGRIVSRRKHASGKRSIKHLEKLGYKAKKGHFMLFRKGRKGSRKMMGGTGAPMGMGMQGTPAGNAMAGISMPMPMMKGGYHMMDKMMMKGGKKYSRKYMKGGYDMMDKDMMMKGGMMDKDMMMKGGKKYSRKYMKGGYDMMDKMMMKGGDDMMMDKDMMDKDMMDKDMMDKDMMDNDMMDKDMMGGKKYSRKYMKGGMAYGGPLSPHTYDGRGVGTSGAGLQIMATTMS